MATRMRPQNLLIIMSDEHSPKALGCYGHALVQTPNLDRLAASGTRFASAYTTSPVCIPARAGFACGRYIHQIGFWDNADPYDGSVPSWHHRLRDAGHEVVSIGKLHFRSSEDDNGFSEEIVPMHVIDGQGDVLGLVRDRLPVRGGAYKMARFAGPGESSYTFYDREIAARAQIWLREKAKRPGDRPWVLFVSFVCPHFPLTAPPEYYYRYYNDPRLPMPKLYQPEDRPMHPYLETYRRSFVYDDHFDEEKVRMAVAGYFGLCSFLDDNVGKVLSALADAGLAKETRVLYTSDHGDNLGSRGCWGKSTLYEEAAAVPLIAAGEGIPVGRVIEPAASHVDCFGFILSALGHDHLAAGEGLPGTPLQDLANGFARQHDVMCEYHGMGSTTGAFMLRYGSFKLIYYVGLPAQLFDLGSDPEELFDLANQPAHARTLAQLEQRLRSICDPEEVDARAKRRQQQQLERYGGRHAAIARGDLGFTPAPGVAASFD
jgi:choline-sulfatase